MQRGLTVVVLIAIKVGESAQSGENRQNALLLLTAETRPHEGSYSRTVYSLTLWADIVLQQCMTYW